MFESLIYILLRSLPGRATHTVRWRGQLKENLYITFRFLQRPAARRLLGQIVCQFKNQNLKYDPITRLYNIILSFANWIGFREKKSSWIKFVFKFWFRLQVVKSCTRKSKKWNSKLYLSFLELLSVLNVSSNESFFKLLYNVLSFYLYAMYCRFGSSREQDCCETCKLVLVLEYKHARYDGQYVDWLIQKSPTKSLDAVDEPVALETKT